MKFCTKHWEHLKANTPKGTWLMGTLLAMKKILDTPRSEGGAIAIAPDATIYQFIAVPAELDLYVQAPGYQDWVLVEYGELFN